MASGKNPLETGSTSNLDVEILGPRLDKNSDKYVQKISDRIENLARE